MLLWTAATGLVTASELGPLTLSGGAAGTGWVIVHIRGTGDATLRLEGERPTGLGVLAGSFVSADGQGWTPTFRIVTEAWYVLHAQAETPLGPVGLHWPGSQGNSYYPYERGVVGFDGDITFVGVAAGGFAAWRWGFEADDTFEIVSVRTSLDPPLLVPLDEFNGPLVVNAQADAVGAHALVQANTAANIKGRLWGAFFKHTYPGLVDGVDLMEVVEPDGSVRVCTCHWTDLDGSEGDSGAYEFRVTGAALRAVVGETIFVLAVDLPANVWAPAS